MTTRDPFLDMLAVATARPVTRAPFPVKPPPAAPKPPTLPAPPNPPRGIRDPNIDAMIAQWVADGELILDVELDAYRVPRRRRWRYATES